MLAWASQSDFDFSTLLALWSMVAAGVTTFILFIYTMALRLMTILHRRRHKRIVRRWRLVFARAALSDDCARMLRLPSLRRSHRIELLEEWNKVRIGVEGQAADNLQRLAQRAGIPVIAGRLFEKTGLHSQLLAVQTLGHLRDTGYRGKIRGLVDDPNTALSITAAVALVEIDAPYAIEILVPMIPKRRDWPKPRVSQFLLTAGHDCIGEPMFRAIRSADDDDKAYLLKFTDILEHEVLDTVAASLIRESDEPAILKAALKRISGLHGIPRIAALTQHEAWFVRMEAAKALGRVATEERVPLLERLLSDRHWWVRYRTAQALVRLPFLGPNCLRRMQLRQNDPFAVDILEQAFAEVGLV